MDPAGYGIRLASGTGASNNNGNPDHDTLRRVVLQVGWGDRRYGCGASMVRRFRLAGRPFSRIGPRLQSYARIEDRLIGVTLGSAAWSEGIVGPLTPVSTPT